MAYTPFVPTLRPNLLPTAVCAVVCILSACSDDTVKPGMPGAAPSTQWDATVESYASVIRDIWGRSSEDLFVIGQILAHYDGRTWRALNLPGARSSTYRGWGVANGDIYVVDPPYIHRGDGEVWDHIRLPFNYNDVWGAPDGEIYTAGWDGRVSRYDGFSWQSDSLTDTALLGVWGTSSRDVYVAGDYGILGHFDGTAWTVTTIDSTLPLNKAWREADGPLRLAIGVRLYEYTGVLTRLNPELDFRLNCLNPEGPYGFVAGGWSVPEQRGAAYRYDGATWTPLLSTSYEIQSIWTSPAGEAVLGGSGVWSVHNGETRTILDRSYRGHLSDFWRTPAGAVIAVGTKAFRIDGATWTDLEKDKFVGWQAYAAHGRNADDFYVVGDAMVLHYSGKAWDWVGNGFGGELRDVYVSPRGVFVVGRDGLIARYDGNTWHRMDSGTTNSLNAIWGWDEGAFAVGEDGIILRLEGDRWYTEKSPATYTLTKCVGFGPNRVIALGNEHSSVCVYDGGGWRTELTDIPTTTHNWYFADLWGSSPNDLFASRYGGEIFHYDGSAWTLVSRPKLYDALAGTTLPNNDMLVTDGSTVLRYHRP